MGWLAQAYLDYPLCKEELVLISLSWWLALMCYLNEWRAETRVRSEFTACADVFIR